MTGLHWNTTASPNQILGNLVIFVTARLVKPNEEAEESEDLIEPPILPEIPFSKK